MFVLYPGEVSTVYSLSAWHSRGALKEISAKEAEQDTDIEQFKRFFRQIK